VNPTLVVIAGPSKDVLFPLGDGEIAIGREPANQIAIPDPSLSRRHCLLTRSDDGYRLKDLNSRNGTYVNGKPIKESLLQHGDKVSIGDSVFLFQDHKPGEERSGSSEVKFEDSLTHATAQLHPQDVMYLHPDRIADELVKAPRTASNLNSLLKISRAVHELRELEELQAKVLELIFEVAPAERGAVLLDGHGDDFRSVYARHRNPRNSDAIRVSRTISRQAMEEGVAVLGSDVLSDSNFKGVDSLVLSEVRSLICVPVAVFDKIIGCIYLDTTAAQQFDREHLELVAAIANISATALDAARRVQWLEEENLRLRREIDSDYNLVGDSPRMKQVDDFLSRVARSEATVLLTGESGTGKEVAARVIHRRSARASKAFVPINCAAIPEGLLESELFGHERGSFTGAVGLKKGRFEVANGGTVFLDEIGELAPSLQVKLLRVLQEREFERVGGTRPISVDIRLIVASNKDLAAAVKEGTFRQDLFYRLNVVSVAMPALRERRDDISMLAEYFVRKHSHECKVRPKPIAREAMSRLVEYDWPGNVRELENAIERALVMSVSDEIRPEDLPETVLEKATDAEVEDGKYHAAVKGLKKQLILDALQQTDGNYTEAAAVLGLHPNYLHRLIKNLDLKSSVQSSLPTRRR